MSLIRRFMSKLLEEVGEFMETDVVWGFLIFDLCLVVVEFVYFKFDWTSASQDFWFTSAATVLTVCLFTILVIIKTTKDLWSGPVPSAVSDTDERPSATRIFRLRVLGVCSGLILVVLIPMASTLALMYQAGHGLPLGHTEMANAAESITMAVQFLGPDGYPPMPPVKPDATGTLIDLDGHVVTCLNKKVSKVAVSVAMGLSVDDNGNVRAGNFHGTYATVRYWEPSTGLSVLDVVVPKDYVANRQPIHFDKESVKAGEEIVRSGFDVENSGLQETTIVPEFGTAIRYDLNDQPTDPIALYLSVPYRNWDCGAPVVNDRGHLIGVVAHGDTSSGESRTVVIPSAYVKQLLNAAGVSYSQ